MLVSKEVKGHTQRSTYNYPILLIDKEEEFVVLFEGEDEGMVVYADYGADYEVGHYSADWCMGDFMKYEGKIELSNEGESNK